MNRPTNPLAEFDESISSRAPPPVKTIKEIVRDLKVSRNTVRKILRSGETAFACGRKVQPRPKLGRWLRFSTSRWLPTVKPSREELTLTRLFEELRTRGYAGGYDLCGAMRGGGARSTE